MNCTVDFNFWTKKKEIEIEIACGRCLKTARSIGSNVDPVWMSV